MSHLKLVLLILSFFRSIILSIRDRFFALLFSRGVILSCLKKSLLRKMRRRRNNTCYTFTFMDLFFPQNHWFQTKNVFFSWISVWKSIWLISTERRRFTLVLAFGINFLGVEKKKTVGAYSFTYQSLFA